jgi:hypothetical protein
VFGDMSKPTFMIAALVGGLALVVGAMAVFPAPSIAAAQITEIIDSTGDGAGNTLHEPYGIAVDGAGNVYVSGIANDNAFKITPPLPVGGIAEYPDVAGTGDTLARNHIIIAAVSAMVAFGAGAFYARRRWQR